MVMKNLKDVLEKLRVDDIVLPAKFPINGTVDDITKFLENNDFKLVHFNGAISEGFNKCKSKCFYKNTTQLWFVDTSKEPIWEMNPIFTYRILSNSFGVYYFDAVGRICWLTGELGKIKNSKENREEFLEELNKRFGWE